MTESKTLPRVSDETVETAYNAYLDEFRRLQMQGRTNDDRGEGDVIRAQLRRALEAVAAAPGDAEDVAVNAARWEAVREYLSVYPKPNGTTGAHIASLMMPTIPYRQDMTPDQFADAVRGESNG